ncbi:hypothetical protein J6590_040236 [Homalodisca vitripennis]|nr:hypothetical protein J6590_040236 [Homalodisca vitripennis]
MGPKASLIVQSRIQITFVHLERDLSIYDRKRTDSTHTSNIFIKTEKFNASLILE